MDANCLEFLVSNLIKFQQEFVQDIIQVALSNCSMFYFYKLPMSLIGSQAKFKAIFPHVISKYQISYLKCNVVFLEKLYIITIIIIVFMICHFSQQLCEKIFLFICISYRQFIKTFIINEFIIITTELLADRDQIDRIKFVARKCTCLKKSNVIVRKSHSLIIIHFSIHLCFSIIINKKFYQKIKVYIRFTISVILICNLHRCD